MRPKICVSLVRNDPEAAKNVAPLIDFFEVRIDLIGEKWTELVRDLGKPWIACNRSPNEGGNWAGTEDDRLSELHEAINLGAKMVDIELSTKHVERFVSRLDTKITTIVSHHDFEKTPDIDSLQALVNRQLSVGADICKVVTTARKFEDNLVTLKLIAELPAVRLVSFAMGPAGVISRVVSPLAGAEFTYASLAEGQESAAGQLTAVDLRNIYGVLTFESHIGQN